jgi:hypothetical protein
MPSRTDDARKMINPKF